MAIGGCPKANMPIIVSVDHERNDVRAVAVGPPTFDDLGNHVLLERYFNGLAYRELIDARGAWVALKRAEVRKIAELIRNLGFLHPLFGNGDPRVPVQKGGRMGVTNATHPSAP